MKLKMLGVGNGFSKGVYDNNALVYCNEEKFGMIDCGITAWTSLEQMGIERDKIDSIFTTHIHFDHTGGVESAALYGKFITGKKMRLIVPEPIKDRIWDYYLKGAIEDTDAGFTSLEEFFDPIYPKEGEEFELTEGITAKWLHVKHLDGKFACGLIINDHVFYTSDMITDVPLLEEKVEAGVDVILHDAHFRKVINHAHYEEILEYPDHIKEKMYLMHHGLLDESSAPDDGVKFLYQHREYDLGGE